VCCLPPSFCSVLKAIKMAENIDVKELLDNTFSVARYMINKEK
jgi:hypothetical protein